MSPISMADLMAEEATVTVETRLGAIEVTYRPNAMTPRKEAELARLSESNAEDADIMLARLFCEVVSDTGIVGPMLDDEGEQVVAPGEPIPMEPELIVDLSSRFMGKVFAAIQQQLENEAAEKGKGSRRPAKPSMNGSRRGSFTRS